MQLRWEFYNIKIWDIGKVCDYTKCAIIWYAIKQGPLTDLDSYTPVNSSYVSDQTDIYMIKKILGYETLTHIAFATDHPICLANATHSLAIGEVGP